MTSENWIKVRIALGVLTLSAVGAFLWFVIPKQIAFQCGITVAIDVEAPSNTLCRIEYETVERQHDGHLEVRVPVGNSEVKCFLPTQAALRKVRFVSSDVKTGVVRLMGDDRIVRAVDVAHLPDDLCLQPVWIPHWRER